MSRTTPVMRTIEVLLLIERNRGGLRVPDMAEQLGAPTRAIYRDLKILQDLRFPLYTDKSGRESYWKIDPDYRNSLSIPFSTFRACLPLPGRGLDPPVGGHDLP